MAWDGNLEEIHDTTIKATKYGLHTAIQDKEEDPVRPSNP